MVAKHSGLLKNHGIINFKLVNFTVCELYIKSDYKVE